MGTKYPEKVRHFCFGLITHSPRAYQFIRKTFNNHLPSLKTIQNWFANSDIRGDPGILKETMERLSKIAENYTQMYHRELKCSLVFDEIWLRQQVLWSLHQMEYVGYVNYGKKSEKPENTVAKQAIVFLLNGIDVNLEFPVAYFLIDELVAAERSKLLENVIATVTRCGIQITNITFDGYAGNVPACELLGAKLKINCKESSHELQPFIMNTITKNKIYIILDPCHMEKLVRNRWDACQVFFDRDGRRIEWKFIVELFKFSNENDFRTHKLTRKHIEWKRIAMNVRLAAETFSESVASSIEFLMNQGVPEFQGADATVSFIRRMNTLFDIFNSRYSHDKNIFKRRLSAENKRVIFDFFEETTNFFKALKVEQVFYKKVKSNESSQRIGTKQKVVSKVEMLPILHTRHKTGFRGFIIDMASLKAMFQKYIEEEHSIESIPTYNLLQDVLEMMFGRIRACGGFNNNPNVQQFKGAYRKIQLNMRMDLSPYSNCRSFDMHLPDNLFYSNIYFVTSRRTKITMDETKFESQKDSILESVGNYDAIEGIEMIEANHHLLDGTAQFMIRYLASKIEQKIVQCKSFHCNSCRLVFDENEKDDFSIDSHVSSWTPCYSTIEICKNAEKFFKIYDGHQSKPRYDFKVLYCLIFRTMNFDKLYPNSAFKCDYNHKYQFIKCVVGQYTTMRATQIARQKTLERHDKMVRQQYNRLVNFKGQ